MIASQLLDPLALTPDEVEAWERLGQNAATPNAFLQPAFAIPAVRHLPGGAQARLLVVTSSPEHWTAATLVVPGSRWRRLPLPALGTWANDQQGLATPLLDALDTEQAAVDLVAAFQRHAPRALLLGLDEQDADGRTSTALGGALDEAGWRRTTWRSVQRAVLRRSEAEPSILVESPRLRTKRRKLERQRGPIQVRDCSAPADAEVGARTLLRLEESGWKGRHGTAMSQRPGEEALLLEVARAASERGALRSLVLMAGELPVAAQMDLVAGDTWFHWKTAYDESHSATSPGRLLLTHVLERFDHEALACFDACTVPDHPVMDRLLPHRRTIVEVAVSRRVAPTAVVRTGRGVRRWRESRR